MATIKSFTSLEQSKKLAEILPIESADMFYIAGKGEPIFIGNKMVAYGDDDYDALGGPDVLCWSLAALLELLPKRLEIVDNVYELSVYLYGLYYWNINNGNLCFEAKDKDNFVDACYEAIVFLYEQKFL